MNRLPPAVLFLVIANAAIFAAGLLLPSFREQAILLGAFWFPANEYFRVWQAVTYMFLHADPGHILFNMVALISFGVHLEQRWKSRRFIAFWILCGIGGGILHGAVATYRYREMEAQLVAEGMSVQNVERFVQTGRGNISDSADAEKTRAAMYQLYAAPMIGASGALYGVMVAFGILYPNAKMALLLIPVPLAAKIVIPGLLLLDLLSGVTGFSVFGRGIAHFAHLGGALTGFVVMLVWRNCDHAPDPFRQPRTL